MGLKYQLIDDVTPLGGKKKPQACTRKKEGCCTRATPADLDPGGVFPFLLDVDTLRPMTSSF
jgi:hypothetical protein